VKREGTPDEGEDSDIVEIPRPSPAKKSKTPVPGKAKRHSRSNTPPIPEGSSKITSFFAANSA